MNSVIKDYLVQRFFRNNHNKYRKYCIEWVSNVTEDQVKYFIEERRRLSL